MKKTIAAILAFVLALTMAACSGVAAPPGDGDASASPSAAKPTQSQTETQGTVAGQTNTLAGTPKAGDFLYIAFNPVQPVDPDARIIGGLNAAHIIFMGDTSSTEYLDISEFTVYIDGEPQSLDNTFQAGVYDQYSSVTTYRVSFYAGTIPDPPPIPQQVAKIWIEAVINGVDVRMETHDWLEDGHMSRLGDASISQPLVLGAPSSSSTPYTPPTSEPSERVRQWEITLQLNNQDEPYTGVYSGEVLNGLPHGQGSFATTNAMGSPRIYDGEWNAGHLEGAGRLEYRNRIKFEGTFENDLMANGKLYDATGQIYYEGEFRDGLRLEDTVARQVRIDSYNATPFPSGGDYSQYLGQVVTVEREIVDVVPDGSAAIFIHYQPDGKTLAGVSYYPSHGETLPQPGNRIVWYYLVYETNGSVAQDLVAFELL